MPVRMNVRFLYSFLPLFSCILILYTCTEKFLLGNDSRFVKFVDTIYLLFFGGNETYVYAQLKFHLMLKWQYIMIFHFNGCDFKYFTFMLPAIHMFIYFSHSLQFWRISDLCIVFEPTEYWKLVLSLH